MTKTTQKPFRTTARSIAVEQLLRIEESGVFVSRSRTHGGLPDRRDERLVMEYVAGITRLRRRLDFLIGTFYRGDAETLEPQLLQILRLGVYDLLYLNTPSHAAIHESVELAKNTLRRGAGNLVNGVLRSVDRSRDSLPAPATGHTVTDLGIIHSHPDWMVRRWVERFGTSDTVRLLEWNNARPVYCVRPNSFKISADELAGRLDELKVPYECSPYSADVFRVGALHRLIASGDLQRGQCSVQDEAAFLAVRLLDPRPGETLIDACAAPGAKSFYAAELMNNEGRIIAVDSNATRLDLVRQGAEERLVGIIELHAGDFQRFAESGRHIRADRILVDAPCTGTGVMAKRADLRWNRKPEDLRTLIAIQDELLNAAAVLVKPGGLLVYSTCSIEPEENEDRIRTFLARHENFSRERAEGFVPSEMVTPEGFFASLPHRHSTDGAFGARLRRGS